MGDFFQLRPGSLTDKGKKKRNNEDYVTYYEPSLEDPPDWRACGRLFIVADGVGGAAAGEWASWYAAEKVKFLFYHYQDSTADLGERLQQTIRQASYEIYQRWAQSGERQMATTLVAAVIDGDRLTVANVGDSRAYLIRNGQISQLSEDHTTVGEMVRNGLMTEQEAEESPIKNRLARSLGGDEDVRVYVTSPVQIAMGDKILLCTDGLTRYASNLDLVAMTNNGEPDVIAERLVNFANQHGGADNITVLLATVDSPVLPGSAAKTVLGQRTGNTKFDLMDTRPFSPSFERAPRAAQFAQPSSKRLLSELMRWLDIERISQQQRKILSWFSVAVVTICLVSSSLIALSAIFPWDDTPDPTTVVLQLPPALTSTISNSFENGLGTLTPLAQQTTSNIGSLTPDFAQTTVVAYAAEQTNARSTPLAINPVNPSITLSVAPDLVEDWICVRQVKEGDRLSSIVPDYSGTTTYYYFESNSCNINKEPPICIGNRIPVKDNNFIQPGYWIILDVSTQECNRLDGGEIAQWKK